MHNTTVPNSVSCLS